ncbi:MAG: hypothetical protein JSW26_00540 [Desulfobacterales bacterium]|nr:MAG: hypothetical protein JSW26_00540 [Desulfobacterales bacterium]
MPAVQKSVTPPFIRKSKYGPSVGKRAVELPEIVSLRMSDLFPDIPDTIYTEGECISSIRKATQNALNAVNMDMIKAGDSVNILSSQYGFQLMGGDAYAEMLRTIKDVVEQKTGCRKIRLRVATGFRIKEPDEIIEHYQLDACFNGEACSVTCLDKGVPIDTEIGTLYGIASIYDADWIIHAHHGELRELDMHRMINRAVKPFAMSYARLETRGVAHINFGPRSANFIQKAIFYSPFVQQKFAFGCFLMTSPAGITGVEASRDLETLDRKMLLFNIKPYGKVRQILSKIDDCVVILDGSGEPRYMLGGGISFGNFTEAELDLFDLDVIPVSLGYNLYERPPGPRTPSVNPAIKALVINHMWLGVPQMELPGHIPTIVVGREMEDIIDRDPMNTEFMNYAVTAQSLEAAVKFAKKIAGTDRILVFDGSFGNLHLSESLAEFLIEVAPEVSREVEQELLPKWLHQRDIELHEI